MLHETGLLPRLITIGLLVAASALFSGMEAAFLSANRIRMRAWAEAGDRRAALFSELTKRPDKVVATLLVGNNVVNILAAALATDVALRLVGSAAVAVATGVMTLTILFFGEITPKSWSIANAERVSLAAARPLLVLEWLLWPLVASLTWLSDRVLRLFGARRRARSPFITEEEIKLLARVGEQEGTIERAERELIHGVFQFTDRVTREVMTPFEKVEGVSSEASLMEALHLVNASGHSRLPVFVGKRANVVGMVYAKDLLRYDDLHLHRMLVVEILRPIPFVRDDEKVSRVLKTMQRERHQIAIVADAERRPVGLLSVEDILEEMVGEILDEYDVEAERVTDDAKRAAAKARLAQAVREAAAENATKAAARAADSGPGRAADKMPP